MSSSQQPPQHSLSWSFRTRITIMAMTLLMFDYFKSVWQRLTSPHPRIINFPQDLPADWEQDLEEEDILQWLEYLDEPLVMINCSAHLDRCLDHPSALKNLNSSKSNP